MWRFFAFLLTLAVVGSPTAAAQPAFLVKDIDTTSPLADSSSIGGSTHLFGMLDFVEHDGKLLFTADDGSQGRQLWVSDATSAGTRRPGRMRPGARMISGTCSSSSCSV